MSAAKVLVLPVLWAVQEDVSVERGQGEDIETSAWRKHRVRAMFAAAVDLPSFEDTADPCSGTRGEVAFYRKYTEGLLRRYLRLSMEAGRVPSLIGRPMFRGGRVTRYKVQGFDDVVIFVYDVERCLRRLTSRQQALIERIALQEHTQSDVAEMLGMSLRSVNRRYPEAIDALSRVFLETRLLEPLLECQAASA